MIIYKKVLRSVSCQRERSPYDWYFMMVYPMLYTMLHHAHDELKKFYDLIKRDKKNASQFNSWRCERLLTY